MKIKTRGKNNLKKKGTKFSVQNLKIGYKFGAALLIVNILFVIATLIIFFQLNIGKNDIAEIHSQSERVRNMSRLATAIQTRDIDIADYINSGDKAFEKKFEQQQEEIVQLVDKLLAEANTDREKELLEDIRSMTSIIHSSFIKKIIQHVNNEDTLLANVSRKSSTIVRTDIIENVRELMDIVSEEEAALINSTTERMNGISLLLLTVNLVAIVIGLLLMFLISRRVSRRLHQLVEVTKDVAAGKLNVPAIQYQDKDEIGQLSTAINQMKDNIHQILSKVIDASNSLAQKSEELTIASSEVKEGNEQIANTMQELAAGSETQANGASELSEKMGEFVQMVQESENSGQIIENNSRHVLTLTDDGKVLMEKSVKQMKQIDSIVSQSVDNVKQLDRQSLEIQKLVLVIKDIAEQTNLLSLNAAIEAARAGEHGKGFAVVAEEVRKLSDQVSSSVEEITSIVTAINTQINHVVDSLGTGYKEVEEGTRQIEETGQKFTTIQQAVSEMAEKIAAISENLQEINENSNSMNTTIEGIASISEESAAGVEQASASAQQTAGSMDEVANHAKDLAALAEQLKAELKVFKL